MGGTEPAHTCPTETASRSDPIPDEEERNTSMSDHPTHDCTHPKANHQHGTPDLTTIEGDTP